MEERQGINWYSVIVFESEQTKIDFCKKINVSPREVYITEEQVLRLERYNNE